MDKFSLTEPEAHHYLQKNAHGPGLEADRPGRKNLAIERMNLEETAMTTAYRSTIRKWNTNPAAWAR